MKDGEVESKVKVLEVLNEALKLVTPDREEVERGKKAEKILRERLDKFDVEYEFVGSYARNTWLKGHLEIDVFLLFPETLPIEELEKKGLEIGKSVVDSYELRYAAHPYVHGKVEGVEVDVVPCYKLKSAEKIKSAVDRTPFHHRWLKDRIKGKEKDVRLLKGFLKAGGIYGAEYKVRGFSGYLCELLVVFYGSFLKVIENGKKFTRRTVIDVEGNKVYSGDSFTVIDPVDSSRNVAANLSINNLAKFVQMCREFLEEPSINFFKLRKKETIILEKILKELKNRYVYCICTSKPDIVEDNLYTQLERGSLKVYEMLKRLGFQPMRYAYYSSKDKCYMLFETAVERLSAIEKKMGPMFEDEKNVKKFLRKNKEYKYFIEDGRFYVFSKRKIRSVEEALNDYASNNWRAFGKNLGKEVKREFKVFRVLEVEHGIEEDFLSDFLCIGETQT